MHRDCTTRRLKAMEHKYPVQDMDVQKSSCVQHIPAYSVFIAPGSFTVVRCITLPTLGSFSCTLQLHPIQSDMKLFNVLSTSLRSLLCVQPSKRLMTSLMTAGCCLISCGKCSKISLWKEAKDQKKNTCRLQKATAEGTSKIDQLHSFYN